MQFILPIDPDTLANDHERWLLHQVGISVDFAVAYTLNYWSMITEYSPHSVQECIMSDIHDIIEANFETAEEKDAALQLLWKCSDDIVNTFQRIFQVIRPYMGDMLLEGPDDHVLKAVSNSQIGKSLVIAFELEEC